MKRCHCARSRFRGNFEGRFSGCGGRHQGGYFDLSAKSPSLTAAYAPAKKPMKLEPIVMIQGGLISDKTPKSMSQACSTAPPIVPARHDPKNENERRLQGFFHCRPKGSGQHTPLSAITPARGLVPVR